MTTIKKICAALAATMLLSSSAMLVSSAAPADDKEKLPSEVNADVIEYDMNTGVVAAEGNILLKHGPTRATGLHALFNVNTKEAQLIGDVIVVREDMRITCNALASNGQGHMSADGNVVAIQTLLPNEKYPDGDQRTFSGDHIDYFPDDRKHVIIPNGGVAESKVEGTFTADQMEGWIDDEHYIGNGNAHLVNLTRNLEAGGDQVDYRGKEDGKAVLSGNAWAIQDNNPSRGNRMIVYLADDGNLKAERIQMPPFPETPTIKHPTAPVQTKPAAEKKSADENKIADDAPTTAKPFQEATNHES
ncbi:MAG: organic solvent tolerance protein OstA [Selenomonadaceae bacterium]|nr:organic solvent tolerance protein OstA [Selenomonadaceae bacterium]